jgi:response regulator of citrate/malate metabolism
MSNLSRFELKRIKKSLEVLKDKSNHFSKLDQYSSSHLNEIHSLISKAEDSTYLYNPSSGVGNMSLQFLMGELQNDLNK